MLLEGILVFCQQSCLHDHAFAIIIWDSQAFEHSIVVVLPQIRPHGLQAFSKLKFSIILTNQLRVALASFSILPFQSQ